MRAVVCRVDRAAVEVDGRTVGSIERGLLVYLGVMSGDDEPAAAWMADKLGALRIFPDEEGKMNRSVRDVGGAVLLIPNFTLAGRATRGTRPSFSDAAAPALAAPLFDRVVAACGAQVPVATGVFAGHMLIDARFNGPVTIVIDSAAR